MSEIQIVKVDEGGVNARILAKEAKADFRRVEAASLKIPTRFTSAEGKRFFARLFNTLQLNTHFISVIARTRLDHEDVAKIEGAIRTQMEAVAANLNQAIDDAEALFKAHAITSVASYDTVPLDVDVHVLSSIGRRYLELLGKLDQLMPLLQTLEIHEVITTQAVDIQRASLKRQVRDLANAARNLAMGLRRRMNALGLRVGDGGRQEAVASGVSDGTNTSETEREATVNPLGVSTVVLPESLEDSVPSIGD
ncbi:AcaB family transcriptional regulator [Dechloromonas sp. CZR5]|uniref:AcaB family transcriptional regulator n=1 Tax=Dechloromonas sp. CZR5 TaxID=2608630 RepID=UPI00123C8070|nr:AcaB family transcriptional regulator [Dechloromonas sp. CZR5]